MQMLRILLNLSLAILLFSATGNAENYKFKVGVILPLTGIAADYGEAIRNSILMAIADEQQSFSNVEFIFEDAMYDNVMAIQAFNKLKDLDKVDLLYIWGVTFCQAVVPLALKYQIPFIAQSVDPSISRNSPNVIRFSNPTSDYAQKMLDYLRYSGLKKFAFILSDNSYIEESFRGYEENLQNGETISIVDRYHLNNSDFRSAISKLKSADYDAVGVYLLPGQIASFFKQARQQNYKNTFFGPNTFESKSEILAAAGSMEGAYLVNNQVESSFQDKYLSTYGNDSQISFGGYAYEFARLCSELFNNLSAKPEFNQTLMAFEQSKFTEGIAYKDISFKNSTFAGKYFAFPISIKIIRDSEVLTHFGY